MNQQVDVWEQKKREFFSREFSKLLEAWKKKEKAEGRKGRQEDFARKINGHPNSISRYKNGTDYPSPSAIDAICEEFGVNKRIFEPIFEEERGGDKSFHDEKERELRNYCDSIGLNVNLVSFITSEDHVRNSFPVHPNEIEHRPPAPEYPIVKTESPFQIEDDKGKTVFLDSSDLDYLRQLQKELESFIQFKFYEERRVLREKNIEQGIEMFTSHTDLTKEQILAKCQFKESDVSNLHRVYNEDLQIIADAVTAIEKERGEHLIWHWKRSIIDRMFTRIVDPKERMWMKYSGKTDEEIEEYYLMKEKDEAEQREQFIKKIIESGDVIDDG